MAMPMGDSNGFCSPASRHSNWSGEVREMVAITS